MFSRFHQPGVFECSNILSAVPPMSVGSWLQTEPGPVVWLETEPGPRGAAPLLFHLLPVVKMGKAGWQACKSSNTRNICTACYICGVNRLVNSAVGPEFSQNGMKHDYGSAPPMEMSPDYDSYARHLHAKGGAGTAAQEYSSALRAALRIGR